MCGRGGCVDFRLQGLRRETKGSVFAVAWSLAHAEGTASLMKHLHLRK